MLRVTKIPELDCEECGHLGLQFFVDDDDGFMLYGTILCPRCGWEEFYHEEYRSYLD